MDIDRIGLFAQVRGNHREVRRQQLVHEGMLDKALLAIAQVIHALAIVHRVGDRRFERRIPVDLQLP